MYDQYFCRINFEYEQDWTYSISSIIHHLNRFGKGLRRLKAHHISDEIDGIKWDIDDEDENEKLKLLPIRKTVPNFRKVIVQNCPNLVSIKSKYFILEFDCLHLLLKQYKNQLYENQLNELFVST